MLKPFLFYFFRCCCSSTVVPIFPPPQPSPPPTLDPLGFVHVCFTHVPSRPIQKNLCPPMFVAARFTVAKCWKQPKCPSVNEWIKKLWYRRVLSRLRQADVAQIGWLSPLSGQSDQGEAGGRLGRLSPSCSGGVLGRRVRPAPPGTFPLLPRTVPVPAHLPRPPVQKLQGALHYMLLLLPERL